jgi:sugar/nucleoside kinase (ribokinase family)
MKDLDIVVAGHLCLDLYPDLGSFESGEFFNRLQPGKLLSVGNMSFCTGGPVSNTGLALDKLGMKVGLMGKVGQDAFGEIIKSYFTAINPAFGNGLIISSDVGSSYTIILSAPGIDRVFLTYPGANDTFGPDDIDYELVSRSRLFHFGYPPLMKRMFADDGIDLAEIYRRVKECGVITSLDMALPDPNSDAGRADWLEILEKTLPYVDIFAPSIEEILFMLDKELFYQLQNKAITGNILPLIEVSHLTQLAKHLNALGAKVIAIKLGDRGFFIHTGDQEMMAVLAEELPIHPEAWASLEIWAPCFCADFVGAAGSGDATVAGFLTSLLKGLSIEQAATMAVGVGACCVEALDTVSGIQDWQSVSRRISADWKRHAMVINEPGWLWDEKSRNWIRKLSQ